MRGSAWNILDMQILGWEKIIQGLKLDHPGTEQEFRVDHIAI
jgi:hypothetical protein